MFQIYLPIAEMSVDIFLLLGMGGAIGFLSGLFGVGGGFLITPLLIFIGVPPPVAVGSSVNQVVAASVSGAIAHWRRGNIDFRMGTVLLVGGVVGSLAGILLFDILESLGQIDLVIQLSYVVMLGGVGALMLVESGRAILMRRRGGGGRRKKHVHTWIHGLPLKMRFRTSRLYISALLPLGIGFAVGILAALMGVGGGFFLVPAMIYLLGMPVTIVIGTSLYQITVVAGATTFLHAISGQTVDIVLAGVLTIGAVVGAQLGTRFGAGIRGEELRGLLALMVLIVCAALFWELVATPQEMFNLSDLMVMP
ncbi:MAG: sulfite exporter TauE/SafE family protein [Proteobacteria bacterium]|nr:sulfite exporter TauE/SafE family protein [Pseudomonadota bacterium]MDA0951166.1 sulfite exporter TauE/SafE family protein [Pseudomonadota bacterium]